MARNCDQSGGALLKRGALVWPGRVNALEVRKGLRKREMRAPTTGSNRRESAATRGTGTTLLLLRPHLAWAPHSAARALNNFAKPFSTAMRCSSKIRLLVSIPTSALSVFPASPSLFPPAANCRARDFDASSRIRCAIRSPSLRSVPHADGFAGHHAVGLPGRIKPHSVAPPSTLADFDLGDLGTRPRSRNWTLISARCR